MDRAYAAAYRALHEGHWWWRARERILLDELERVTPDGGWGRILDIGCADGLLFPLLTRWGVVEGVEPDPLIVSRARREDGTIHQVPFDAGFRPGHRYGLILMLDVLEHLDEPAAALERATDLLAADGRLVITVPAFETIWTRHDDLNEHRTRYTKKRLAGLARGAGLLIEESDYVFQALFFLKLLTRGAEILLRSDPALPAIPPAPVNRLLEAYCVWERRLTRRLHPPFGSSLLCIAHTA